jgi:hypothetical protein
MRAACVARTKGVKMLLKFIKSTLIDGKLLKVGETQNVDNDLAKGLIERKIAEAAKPAGKDAKGEATPAKGEV